MARLAIRMPKMSMTMTEGTVGDWAVAVGDEVNEGDIVVTVLTDKVDMDVEATVSGTLLEIVAETGAVIPVGEPMAFVEGEADAGGFGDLLAAPAMEPDLPPRSLSEETTPRSLSEETTPRSLSEETTPRSLSDEGVEGGFDSHARSADVVERARSAEVVGGPVPAVPRARALAREHGLDLAQLSGTGPSGLIRVGDVRAALAGREPKRPQAAPAVVAAPTPPAPATPPSSQPQPSASAAPAGVRRDPVRAAVARKMVESAAVPQFTVWRELRLDAANARRDKVSWNTVLLRAYAAALREVPSLLDAWHESGGVVSTGAPVVAIAVATDRGLMVPTFAEPDRTPARELDAELRSVVQSTQQGRVPAANLGAANASLSNLGGLGIDRFQALLTPPQASVLSLGSIAERPVAVPGGVGLALTLHAGLTVDHRVADGAHAADLLQRIDRILQTGA